MVTSSEAQRVSYLRSVFFLILSKDVPSLYECSLKIDYICTIDTQIHKTTHLQEMVSEKSTRHIQICIPYIFNKTFAIVFVFIQLYKPLYMAPRGMERFYIYSQT